MKFDPVSFAMGVSSAPVDPELADATATRADILYPKTAYLANGHKNTGTIQSIEAATYTPSTVDQTIQSGKYLAGDQTILGDSNLIADNIKKNISIFGVTGIYSGVIDADKTVHFFDYDGSILYSYTPEEFAALSSLPNNPSHDKLIAQGWNWSLSDAKAYVASYGFLDIGQMFTTASGKTEIDITLKTPNLSPYLTMTTTGTVNIDWGDGSEIQSTTGTGEKTIQHVYSSAGNYTISLSTNATIEFSGSFSPVSAGVLIPDNSFSRSNLYSSTIKAIRLNENTTMGIAAFARCSQLQYITIPRGIQIISEASFYYCHSLKILILPDTVKYINRGAFSDCYSLEKICVPFSLTKIESLAFAQCSYLQRIALSNSLSLIGFQAFKNCSSLEAIIIPGSVSQLDNEIFSNCQLLNSIEISNGVTLIPDGFVKTCKNLQQALLPNLIVDIGEGAFMECYSLQSITIPSSVTKIYPNAFANCYTLSAIHFLSTTPPTVTNSNAFSYIPTNCIIYVPTGSLSAYTSATNYPSSSTYTYVEE